MPGPWQAAHCFSASFLGWPKKGSCWLSWGKGGVATGGACHKKTKMLPQTSTKMRLISQTGIFLRCFSVMYAIRSKERNQPVDDVAISR